MNTRTIEYATQKEVDIKVKQIEERANFKAQFDHEKFSSLEKLLDERFQKLEAVVERNFAQQNAYITELKAEFKALHSRDDVTDRRIDDIHQSPNKWFSLLGFLTITSLSSL